MAENTAHTTVLLNEAITALEIRKGDVVIDGTLGGGGHSEEMVRQFGSDITLIGLDMDKKAIERSQERISKLTTKAFFMQENFRNIDKAAEKAGLENVNRVLLDIGLSSDQFESSGRGFTFRKNEPLLMTFADDPTSQAFTASDIVNGWEEEAIADVIFAYGEEKFARRIAKRIVAERQIKKIETTFELCAVVEAAVPFWYRKGKLNPSTKTFQALRIAVNDELGALKDGITKSFELLSPKGRLAVISFHSLEDRIVKYFFRDMAAAERGVIVTKKAIVPKGDEISRNPRSRSAKLRVIEKN